MIQRFLFCSAALLMLAGGPVAAAGRPNIVLILADDLGWSDLGCQGGEIRTPVLDGLARNGVRFTQFYNSARCCPTRASLLTGLHPHQAGVGSMTNDRGPDHPGYRGTLQPHCVTLAEVLRDAGYHTSMVGKWHLHNKADVKPTDRGFEEFYGMLGGYNSCWEEQPHYTRWPRDRTPRPYTSAAGGRPGTFHATDVFADYALDFMGLAREARKPFFLYLAFNAPHFPLHAWESDIAKYEAMYFEKGWDRIREERMARVKSLGLVPHDLPLPPRSIVPAKSHARPSPYAGRENPAWDSLPEDRRRDLARRMAVYAAMVDRMDAAIGRVVDDLKRNGELENTLILFLSDNGACWEWDPFGFDESSSPKNILHTGEALKAIGQPGDYCSYGSGWANACNTPWRLYKHFCHEGGIRTPMIVHWPAGLGSGSRLTKDAGHLIDVMPTLVEAAGAAYPTERNGVKILPAEGRSLLAALRGGPITRSEPLCFEHEGSRAVRDGKWKLVSLKDDAWELHDLETDPNELRDLVSTHPDKVKELAAAWERWAERCHVLERSVEPASAQDLPTPEIAGKALRIACRVETTARHGVILAHGGRQHGYALHLDDGRVVFTVRRDGKPAAISSPTAMRGKCALIASLERDGTMRLAVDGAEVASGSAGGLIALQPQDGLSIARDDRTAVGDYEAPHPLDGRVTDVAVRAE